MKKILIIRLSSFGDVVQSLSAAKALKNTYPKASIKFLTKKAFATMPRSCAEVDEVIEFDKKHGMVGFIKLCLKLKKESFDIVYDAHLNIRTLVLKLIFFGPLFKFSPKLFIRSKHRIKRFFLFSLGIDLFKEKFIAAESFLLPIIKLTNQRKVQEIKWKFNVDESFKERTESMGKYVALVLGANWDLKRWPEHYWTQLIKGNPDHQFVLLGAKLEIEVSQRIMNQCTERVINLVNELSLVESSYIIEKCHRFISADTGLLHVADSMNLKGFALMGPTAFGYVNSKRIKVLEDESLKCRPCSKDGRGKCSQKVYKQCMVNLNPKMLDLNS